MGMGVSVIGVIGEVVADAVVSGGDQIYDGPRGAADTGSLALTVHPGGSPANVALSLARLGDSARFAGRLSTGSLGRLCRAHLAASGVDLRAAVDAAEPATLAIATLAADGAARYEFYTDGTADWRWADSELDRLVDPALGARPVAVHAGSLALALAPGGARIEAFLGRARPAATISIDPNLRTSLIDAEHYRAAIGRWAALADLIKLSDDDLAELWPGAGPAAAAARLHEAGTALVVITRGGAGCYASLRRTGAAAGEVIVEIPAVATTVVDTVGAGDSFAAGLLHHLGAAGALGGRLDRLGEDLLADAIGYASRVAAVTCSRAGADPPYAAELG